jgi:hypothetical protein
MFYFPGSTSYVKHKISNKLEGFPHSEISGSKVARHLPEAYRSYATSFIVSLSLGIHHMLLNFPLGNLKTTIRYLYHFDDKENFYVSICYVKSIA